MQFDEFEWDDGNLSKVSLRGFRSHELDAVLDQQFAVVRNKRDRAGTHKLIGRSLSGVLVTVVVISTGVTGVWRPVNAWPSDAEEASHARRRGI